MPTQNPTTKQQQVYDFIEWYQGEHGYSPSYREIAKHIGVSSQGTVGRFIDALEVRGKLIRNQNEARSIQLKGK